MVSSTPLSAEEHIHIAMLGEFSITAGDNTISDSTARTHQLWHLIEYLITFRKRDISQEELIGILWPKGEIDNPANALKNLVYRARSALHAHGLPNGRRMIVYKKGLYSWNNTYPCTVDAEEFEQACRRANAEGLTPAQQVTRYQEAIHLYKGDFLPGAKLEPWVIPIASEYRKQYFKCVYWLLGILQSQQQYEDMEQACLHAIAIDPFEETAHRYLIHSLIQQGKQEESMTRYNEVTELLFRELGIGPSTAMRALYREIAKTTHDVQLDLGIIKEDLEETDRIPGAFYCEYEIFKNLYRLEARTAARSGQSVFVVLVTLEDIDGNLLEVKIQNKTMDSLYRIIRENLRKGDVYARFSASQYVMMLPALTMENCVMVMDRVTRRFRYAHRGTRVKIDYKIQPLDPIHPEE